MQTPTFDPNDPRLTAFAFGELHGSDKEAMEQLLADSEEAREALKEIEETVGLVRDELLAEPTPGLTSSQREAIRAAASNSPTVSVGNSRDAASESARTGGSRPKVSSRRSAIAIATTLATSAVVVIAVVINQNSDSPLRTEAPSGSPVNSSLAQADHAQRANDSRLAMTEFGNGEPASDAGGGLGGGFGGGAGLGSDDAASKLRANTSPDSYSFSDGKADLARRIPSNSEGDAAAKGDVATRNRPGNELVDSIRSEGTTATRAAAAGKSNDESQPALSATKPAPPKSGFAGNDLQNKDRTASSPLAHEEKKSDPSDKSAVDLPKADRPVAESARQNDQKRKEQSPTAGSKPLDSAPQADKKGGAKSDPFSAEDIRRNSQPGVSKPAGPAATPAEAAPGGQQPSEPNVRLIPGGGGLSPNLPPAVPNRAVAARESTEAEKQLRDREFRTNLNALSETEALAKHEAERLKQLAMPHPSNEYFAELIESEFIVPKDLDALSTFSIDVDTASYANVRRFLNQDQLPPKNAVRIEELINYFKYDYKQPEGEDPFSVNVEVAACPWAAEHRLARIGLQAKTIAKEQRPRTNLVFLIDESGSMRADNKLPLVKTAMKLLVEELTEDDQISVVTYSSTIKVPLDVTSGAKKDAINSVIDALNAGGSTNGSGGIQKAYEVASKHFLQDSSNRVILCTDGDFNVGISDDAQLVEFIKEKAASGVFLSVFGFGMGNLKDGKLEKLADKGNGHYGYIDNEQEARKVFQEQLTGTLYTVAKDVKLQVDFNLKTVGAYRLIGYENRVLAAADFADDTKDAGEIGAGHSVTALYEIVPVDVWAKRPVSASTSKYQQDDKKPEAAKVDKYADELFTVKLRYKKPDEEKSDLTLDYPVKDIDQAKKTRPSDDFMFTASVASFGMNLRESKHKGSWTLAAIQETAEGTVGDDATGIRREFVSLVKTARRLTEPVPTLTPPVNQPKLEEVPKELPADEARNKASVDNKYRRLLKKIAVEKDVNLFGAFYDYGKWEYTSYAGHTELPVGHWVYVYPNWYIWAEATEPK